jgi:hypothetical protein
VSITCLLLCAACGPFVATFCHLSFGQLRVVGCAVSDRHAVFFLHWHAVNRGRSGNQRRAVNDRHAVKRRCASKERYLAEKLVQFSDATVGGVCTLSSLAGALPPLPPHHLRDMHGMHA